MVAKDHREVARSVIAEAEKAVAELGGAHDARADRLVKLHDLFTVVEQRYLSQQEEVAERDEQIRILSEANDELIQALRSLTEAAQTSARRLGNGNDDLVRAVERSEALVARAFGTGGNANPTQAPDAMPRPEVLDLDDDGSAADAAFLDDGASDQVEPGDVEPDDGAEGDSGDNDGGHDPGDGDDDRLLSVDGDAVDGGAVMIDDDADTDDDMLGHGVGGGADLDDEIEAPAGDGLGDHDDEDPERLADLGHEAMDDDELQAGLDRSESEDQDVLDHMGPGLEEPDDGSSDEDILAFEDNEEASADDDALADDDDGSSSDSEVTEEHRPFLGEGEPDTTPGDEAPGPAEDPLIHDLDAAADAGEGEAVGSEDEQGERPLIDWSEAWSVGAAEMDRDHRILINLVNQLPEAFRDGAQKGWIIGKVLNSLWDYTEYHFNREEALQKAANFPGAEDHAGRHQELKAQVRDWLDRYQADPEAIDGPALLTFLKDWLVNHILGEDMRYKPYVQNNPDAQAVAAAIPADPDLVDDLESVSVMSEAAV